MKNCRNPVIVFGGGLTALGITRAFGKRGIDVYLIMDKRETAAFSNYCRRSFVVSGMRREWRASKNLLVKIAKSFSKRPVIYPTSDLDALNLAKLKEELSDDYYFVVGDKEPIEILVNKGKFYKTLAHYKIDYPKTYFPENLKDAQRIGARMDYPIFVRPAITQLFIQALGINTKGFIAHSPRELIEYYKLATRHAIEIMFQEIIPGPPSNSYQLEGYYNDNHRPTILFARQRLRIWPPDFGNTTLCVSIPLAKMAKEKNLINQFIRGIRYHGLASAEYKRDRRDGVTKLLEINARAWWHFWLSGRCGADIIYSSYQDTIGEKTEHIEQYESGIKSIYLLNDFAAVANGFLNGNLGLREWMASLLGIRQFAFFAKDDLSPFIIDFADRVLQSLKRILWNSKETPIRVMS